MARKRSPDKMRFRLSDLPDNLREQAIRQTMPSPKRQNPIPPKPQSKTLTADSLEMRPHAPVHSKSVTTADFRAVKMSNTEKEYKEKVLKSDARFEPISLRLPGGSRYTPDFLTIDDGIPTLHEVKGSYRLNSQGRALTAFMEAAAAYSEIFTFVWAEKCPKEPTGLKIRRVIPRSPAQTLHP